MVQTDNDHHRVVMAQETSKEQVQGLPLCHRAQRVHLPARLFPRASQRILGQQQLDVFYGRDDDTGYHVHRWGHSEADSFQERL